VLGLFVPLVAIAIFNVLLVYRMRVLNRNKQKAGVQRMRRLTDVARMVLADPRLPPRPHSSAGVVRVAGRNRRLPSQLQTSQGQCLL